jgi:hypothetical protein
VISVSKRDGKIGLRYERTIQFGDELCGALNDLVVIAEDEMYVT